MICEEILDKLSLFSQKGRVKGDVVGVFEHCEEKENNPFPLL